MADTIAFLVARSIPVMGHVGLQPQSFNAMGGYRIQGRDERGASAVLRDARAVAEAGAFSIVIEGTAEPVAREITHAVHVPTIGIGASVACDGQVLVTEDMLGLFAAFKPSFVKRYAELGTRGGGRRRILRARGARAPLPRARSTPSPCPPATGANPDAPKSSAPSPSCARKSCAFAQPWPRRPGADHGRGARRASRAGARRAQDMPARRRHHLRQPDAVRPRRGSRVLSARRGGRRGEVRVRRVRSSLRAVGGGDVSRGRRGNSVGRRVRPRARGEVPARAFRRRRHRGGEAVRTGDARTSPCSARRTTSSFWYPPHGARARDEASRSWACRRYARRTGSRCPRATPI